MCACEWGISSVFLIVKWSERKDLWEVLRLCVRKGGWEGVKFMRGCRSSTLFMKPRASIGISGKFYHVVWECVCLCVCKAVMDIENKSVNICSSYTRLSLICLIKSQKYPNVQSTGDCGEKYTPHIKVQRIIYTIQQICKSCWSSKQKCYGEGYRLFFIQQLLPLITWGHLHKTE